VGGHRLHLGAGLDLDPGPAGGTGQLARQLAHPAHGDVPAAGAVSDHVQQEAAVLAQAGVVGRRERPDRGVGQDQATDQVRVKGPFEGRGQGLLKQRFPGLLIPDQASQLLPAAQWLGERREEASGHPPEHRLEVVLDVLADQQPGVLMRRIRGHGTGPELDRQSQGPDQCGREQAHEV
jgi:hypothetical protein